MLHSLFAIALISISFPLFASKAEPAVTSEKGANIYTEDKQNIVISASQPEFILKLKSNPTTGYSWYLREYDSAIITPVKHSFLPPTRMLIGASGFELWTFRVKPAGFSVPHQTAIRMVYARPWQSNDGATQSVFLITTQGK